MDFTYNLQIESQCTIYFIIDTENYHRIFFNKVYITFQAKFIIIF